MENDTVIISCCPPLRFDHELQSPPCRIEVSIGANGKISSFADNIQSLLCRGTVLKRKSAIPGSDFRIVDQLVNISRFNSCFCIEMRKKQHFFRRYLDMLRGKQSKTESEDPYSVN